MAVLVNVELGSGLKVSNSYARINTVGGGKQGAVIEVNFYVSQDYFQNGKLPVKTEYYNFTPSVDGGADEWIKQGYEHLKTLPEFIGVIDVFE